MSNDNGIVRTNIGLFVRTSGLTYTGINAPGSFHFRLDEGGHYEWRASYRRHFIITGVAFMGEHPEKNLEAHGTHCHFSVSTLHLSFMWPNVLPLESAQVLSDSVHFTGPPGGIVLLTGFMTEGF